MEGYYEYGASGRAHLDYTCAGCGAQAVSVRDRAATDGMKGTRVVVPHAKGCPVAIRVAVMRARARQGAA